ncbi:TIGR01777 family oxidoreductase [Aliarcobacter lanthieri]|uniref:TIGR01777 family oxidoreductase n=1 Tax=Aliarcobacter lanthieri TaxID=1355374 RepID=UPI003AFB08CC
MKTIAISGSSGFVGQSLVDFLSKQNYKILNIKRDDLKDNQKLDFIVNSCDILINLNGANIINRWSDSYKELLVSSRIDTTKRLVNSLKRVDKRQRTFISTSAVGIYDNKSLYDENGSFSNDFLSKLCQNWEKEAQKVKDDFTKVAILRFGIVLGKNGGAFKKMILPFRLGVGGVIGSGKQSFSFIHIEDLLRVYKFIIEKNIDGVFNCTTPIPTTNFEYTKTLGKVLNRPTIFPIPEFILKLIFSEGAKVLTDGQSTIPKNLLDLGFEFKYNNIEETLKSLV